MEVKCGIDIIEISRIKESIENLGENFLNRVFTQKEIDYCESKKVQKYQHYAARFAAKEATFKAVSSMLNDKYKISWKDIEVFNDENGKPTINFYNQELNFSNIDLSISHSKQFAVASVVIIK